MPLASSWDVLTALGVAGFGGSSSPSHVVRSESDAVNRGKIVYFNLVGT